MFHFAKNESNFLWKTMTYFLDQYNPKKWSTGGSDILTRTLKEICDIKPNEHGYKHITGKLFPI